MGDKTERDALVDRYLERTLKDYCPELIPYLKVGANVLDVGCGPGSITLGVAGAVAPGEVIGIDNNGDSIAEATQLARQKGVSNVTFKVGDAHHLELPDDTFDVVYSNTVAHGFIDPVQALREQKRVAKPGGWVIANGVRDWGFSSSRYPPCPKLDQVWDAVIRWREWWLSQRGERGPVLDAQERKVSMPDLHAGRKCVEWFATAGLTDFRAIVKVFRVNYPGADEMEPNALDIIPALEIYPEWYKAMVTEGFLDEGTFNAAREEMLAWYQHPHAFQFWSYVCAAGKA